MNSHEKFSRLLDELPIIAILRGVKPDEVLSIGASLIEQGIRIIEVPLNSPESYRSIEKLVATYGDQILCGAGTVLETQQLSLLEQVGAELVVSPNYNPELIRQSLVKGFVTIPGFFTASEMFQAIAAGAQTLKFFPATEGSDPILAALKSVAPAGTAFFPTGGITPDNLEHFLRAGAKGFGIGSALYKAGRTSVETGERAKKFVSQIKSLLSCPGYSGRPKKP